MKEAANQGGLVESPPKAGMGGDYARNKQIWPRCLTRPLLAAQSTGKRRLCTAHTQNGHRATEVVPLIEKLR